GGGVGRRPALRPRAPDARGVPRGRAERRRAPWFTVETDLEGPAAHLANPVVVMADAATLARRVHGHLPVRARPRASPRRYPPARAGSRQVSHAAPPPAGQVGRARSLTRPRSPSTSGS